MPPERLRLLAASAAVLIIAAVLGLGAWGALPFAPPRAAQPDVDTQTREIAKVLRCPVCQNIAVADSPSELAQQMRDLIHKKVEAGETREQILAYFAERYGDDVLLDPPKRGVAGVLWLGPLVIVAGGAVVVGATIRHWRLQAGARRAGAGALPPSAQNDATLESLADAGGLTPAERNLLAARLSSGAGAAPAPEAAA